MKFLSKYEKIQVIAESGARHATQTTSQMESDSERSFTMIYSHEVEKMCTVAQGVHHGAAPVPTEGKWVMLSYLKSKIQHVLHVVLALVCTQLIQ